VSIEKFKKGAAISFIFQAIYQKAAIGYYRLLSIEAWKYYKLLPRKH
jgi:hypothetical protein